MFKNRIKIMTTFLLAAVVLLSSVQPASAVPITITIYIGKASKGCAGFGICKITVGTELKAAGYNAEGLNADRQRIPRVTAGAAEISGDRMQVNFNRPLPGSGTEDMIPVDEDMVLDAETSKAFGFRRVVILKGEYSINRKAGKFGSAVFNVRTER
jgi:hypothetical protein